MDYILMLLVLVVLVGLFFIAARPCARRTGKAL